MRLDTLLILACIAMPLAANGAEPSTRPSLVDQLAHAGAEVQVASERMAKATAQWRSEYAAAQWRAEARPDIVRLNTAVQEARKRLGAALDDELRPRNGGVSASADNVKDAQAAYLQALKAHENAVHQALADDPALQQAARERAKTLDALRRAKLAQLDLRWTWENREREIGLAIQEKSLAPGMTEAQARQAMGGPGIIVAQSPTGKTLAWECTVVVGNRLVTAGTYARIVGGRVVEMWSNRPQK